MDAKQFLAEFGHIANAPGGVVKLRELVLQLAISGRLTERVAGDTSALELIEDNQNCRKTLVEQKALKRQPVPRPVTTSDQPWILPEGWAWTRLGSVTNYGDAPKLELKDVNEDTWVLELEDIEKNTSKLLTKVFARERQFKSIKNGFPAGAILYGKLRPYLDKVLIADSSGVCTTEINPISYFANIDAGYLRWYLKSSFFIAYANGSTHGMNLPRLGTDAARDALFAFPPLKEQACIVAKVDELMALCDKLDAQQQTRRKLQNKLRQSMLQAVASATNPQELQTSWMRLADNFGWLFHASEDVDEFVAELKNIAVRGLLSLPSTSLSPVDDIMADCDSLRSQYISSGLMRRQKLISVADSDVVYPAHWAIAPFDKVAVVIGGVTKGRDLRGRDVMTCPYLAVANVQRGFIKLNDLKTIQIGKQELNKYLVQEGDLLITEGGDWDTVGRTAIWQGGVDNCLHQNHVFKARVPSLSLLNEWVELVFNSGIGRDYFAGASKQTTNLASINMTQLRSFPMPIPPLDEQCTVLAKLDALTKQVGIWRKKLESKKHLALLLVSATVAAFTGLTIEQEEESMKAPKTELFAPLRLGTAPDIKAQAPLATILARHHGEMSAKDLWQRFGGEIDAFYAQLKREVLHGWILEPTPAEVLETPSDTVSA
ncbi:restriction endonuclease subunit S [Enterobacter ludwigii]|uniref:restriction endonuclease subunit S n=1 Tax=Enterobacter ludwigii TaxID=299767 RepID=UPI000642F68C|nr:restriction endonuclease subunit S [Enterobacter ludwigii]KLP44173.1 type I restriction modification DNA specificity domain protein [Enterobacter ludwigii]